MDVMVLSTITGACVGVLKLTQQESAIYDPITGRKKYIVAGINYDEEFILPQKTTEERLAYTPQDGAMVYDKTDKQIYIGNGTTAGGVLCNSVLYTRMSNAETNINAHTTRLNVHDGDIISLQTRMTSAEADIDRIEESSIIEFNHLLMDQVRFFHAKGRQTFQSISCGDWPVSHNHAFPVDWLCGEWGDGGIHVDFGVWSAT